MMTRAFTIFTFILLGLGSSDATHQKKPRQVPWILNRMGTVEVKAFDANNGRPLDGVPIVKFFIGPNPGEDFTKAFHSSVANDIPFGEYQIEVSLPSYYPERRYVLVYQKKVTIIVGLSFDQEGPSYPYSLRGRVEGLPSPVLGASFVRLIGVYSNESIESAIDPDGSFQVSGMGWEKYFLLVVGKDGVLATRPIAFSDITSGQPIIIDVNSKTK
jgi:hypothetical protein